MMASRNIVALCCIISAYAAVAVTSPDDRCIRHSITKVSCANVLTTDSLVPHPDDCNLFYYCVQPYLPPVCRECPANLHFNPILHVCDWPYRAGCQICSWPTTTTGAPISSTSTSSTSSPATTPANSTESETGSYNSTEYTTEEYTTTDYTTEGTDYPTTTPGRWIPN